MKPTTKRYWAGAALPVALGSVIASQADDCPQADVTIRLCSDFPYLLARPMDDMPSEHYPTTPTGTPMQWLASGVNSVSAQRTLTPPAGEGFA